MVGGDRFHHQGIGDHQPPKAHVLPQKLAEHGG